MSSLLIRKIAPELKASLHQAAAAHQRSMEAHARAILAEALRAPIIPAPHFADVMTALFDGQNGVDLIVPARDAARPPPDFN